MRSDSPELSKLHRLYVREHLAGTDYEYALRIFAGMWAEARALDPEFPDLSNWEDDIAPDLAIARALNGLPPAE